MKNITYLGLEISTVFRSGQDYIELAGCVCIMDERTGIEANGGRIKATVLSEQWGDQNIVSIAAGMDEKLLNCIRCLEEYDLFVGRAAAILESEFTGEFKDFESQAFIDLTNYLEQVLYIDHSITFLPFDNGVKKRLGYQRTWGPDRRSYSIKTNLHLEPSVVENNDILNESVTPVASGPIYNRLRYLPNSDQIEALSPEAYEVIAVLGKVGADALTKADILASVSLSADELSLAMLELIECDMLEEIREQETADLVQRDISLVGGLSILEEVQNRNLARVLELLDTGADVNEVTEDGRNALFIAIENKDVAMVESLLQRGIDPNYESSDGTTALKLCWRIPNRAIEKLLSCYGAEIGLD